MEPATEPPLGNPMGPFREREKEGITKEAERERESKRERGGKRERKRRVAIVFVSGYTKVEV